MSEGLQITGDAIKKFLIDAGMSAENAEKVVEIGAKFRPELEEAKKSKETAKALFGKYHHEVSEYLKAHPGTDSDFDEVDRLYANDKCEKGYQILKERYSKGERSVDLLYRLAQFCNELSSQRPKEKRKAVIDEGIFYAEEALKLDKNNPNALKWTAILLGQATEFMTMKKKIEAGNRIKELLDKAISVLSHDYALLHLRGRFRYQVACLSWIERKLASTFFASVPTATYDDALCDFLAAEKCQPKSIENHLYIGKCYLAMKDKENARKVLTETLSIEPDSDKDRECLSEIRELLLKF
ncbi:unnamed protein product [Caenorhabditis bovis]|uniref:Tetratricopeptide repeat protein n=1 Tax=Caenorhabditis bovis TaxID=2654633 RepID=A0A8S1FE93_9PELO|nr:unnamed protein product [Caenorhabditis bovis]